VAAASAGMAAISNKINFKVERIRNPFVIDKCYSKAHSCFKAFNKI
jgi:hypothetical protein